MDIPTIESISVSSQQNARKRVRILADTLLNPAKSSTLQMYDQSTSIPEGSDECYMVVTHAIVAKNKEVVPNANAPKSFHGVIYNKDEEKSVTKITHSLSQFEKACPGEQIQREDLDFPNSSFLSISTFNLQTSEDITGVKGRKALILLRGITYSVACTTKSVPLESEDPFTRSKETREFRSVGDPYISFSAKQINFVRWCSYDDILKYTRFAYAGPVENIPYPMFCPEKDYPNVERNTVVYNPPKEVKNAKSKTFENAINAWTVPTDTLISKLYPSYKTLLQVCNDYSFYPDSYDPNNYLNGPLPVIIPAPGDNDKETALEKRTTPVTYEPCWRNPSGKHLMAASIHEEREVGMFSLLFMDTNCVSEFGIKNKDNWKRVASQLIRPLRAVILLSAEIGPSVVEEGEVDYSLRGFADILKIDAKRTFSWAGLRVRIEFAEKNILDAYKGKGLSSPFHSKNEQIQLFSNPETKKRCDCFCLNEYNGMEIVTLAPPSEYDVYCVPFSALFPSTDSGDILREQGFFEKNSVADAEYNNEMYIQSERWGAQCLYFVVKK
jgi:hypothetical protein